MPYCTSKITFDVSVTDVDIWHGFAILIVSTTKEIGMSISYELPLVAQKEIKSGFLYIWIPNGNDPKVVRLSDDGEYILEPRSLKIEHWEFEVELAGKFYGPLAISGVDADELID